MSQQIVSSLGGGNHRNRSENRTAGVGNSLSGFNDTEWEAREVCLLVFLEFFCERLKSSLNFDLSKYLW